MHRICIVFSILFIFMHCYRLFLLWLLLWLIQGSVGEGVNAGQEVEESREPWVQNGSLFIWLRDMEIMKIILLRSFLFNSWPESVAKVSAFLPHLTFLFYCSSLFTLFQESLWDVIMTFYTIIYLFFLTVSAVRSPTTHSTPIILTN